MKPSELLARPESWTQGTSARNEHGIPVSADDETAVCWCIIGAMNKCMPMSAINQMQIKYRNAILDMISSDIAWWNDYESRKHPEVIALLQTVEEQLEL